MKRLMLRGYTKDRERGFTLIELLVALGLFMVVMTISTAIFTAIIRANRHAQAKQHQLLALGISIESMLRTIEFGSEYQICSLNTQIKLRNFQGTVVEYHCLNCNSPTNNGVLRRKVGGVVGLPCSGTGANGWVNLTNADQVDINNFSFNETGIGADDVQAQVMVVLEGTIEVAPGVSSSFNMQTTASQVTLDS